MTRPAEASTRPSVPVPYRSPVRIDRDLLGWGVFFVVAGGIALAIGEGLVADRAWWSFWPLILVGIGVGLILRRTALEPLGGLLVAATFGIMVGGSLAGGMGGFGAMPSSVCRPGDGGTPFEPQGGVLGAAASVAVELDCGDLAVSVVPGSDWTIAGSDDGGRGPFVVIDGETLDIRSAGDGPTFLGGERDAWRLALPSSTTTDLRVDVSAGTLRLELGGAQLTTLAIDLSAGQGTVDLTGVAAIDGFEIGVDAGDLGLTLPSRPLTGSIEANAGSVRLCAPADVALRLRTGDSVLAGQDFAAAGLVEVGDAWETPGYDTAATRIELRTEANAGSFRLDPAEGCA